MSDLQPACKAFQEHVLQNDSTVLPAHLKQRALSVYHKHSSDLLHATALLLADDDEALADAICVYFRPYILELCAHLLQVKLNDAHEVLSQTFARVLHTTTRVWPLVKPYLESTKSFFVQLASLSTSRQRRAATTAKLFLQVKPIECKVLWNWTPFFALCNSTDHVTQQNAKIAASILLHMDNSTRNAFLTPQAGTTHASSSTDSQHLALPASWSHVMSVAKSLPPTLCNVCGIVVPFKATSGAAGPTYPPLIETTSTTHALRSLAIALSVERAILVTGTDGCGKTALIRDLARRTGHTNLVELHLDDQMDSKTLVGSYVCTDIPGEFSWQPGALTQAVTEGRWVVIEDIDRASMDVLAALLPLLTTNELMVRGQAITASPGFQLLATSRKSMAAMPKGFPTSLWHHIHLTPLSMDEIQLVLVEGYPQLSAAVVSQMLETFRVVSQESSRGIRQSYGRQFSLRDMLKWCRRLQTLLGTIEAQHFLTQERRESIVREAWDVFCMGIRDPVQRVEAAVAVANLWQVPSEVVEHQLVNHRPVFTSHHKEVQVGRVHLSTMFTHQSATTGHQIPFVLTGHSLRLMEQLAATVATHEPTLLVGETGCGKTTLIQYLASALGQTLVVQNLNVQSDSADLLGGYKPVDMYQLARPLYMDFVALFGATFPSSSNAGFLQVIQKAFDAKSFKKMSQGMLKAVKMADATTKKQKTSTTTTTTAHQWTAFQSDLSRFIRQHQQVESSFAFAFVEGQLVQAMKAGHWILLDEINLASADTLERLSSVLEGEHSGLSLTEKGDVDLLKPHPNFRVFAAMNPPTDVGKKDLPPSLRNRFTQIYVDECVCPRDLTLIVNHQWKEIANAPIADTVEYSLRTLSRSLLMTKTMLQKGYSVQRALYESFSMGFATQLDASSRVLMVKSIRKTFAPNLKQKELDHPPPKPRKVDDEFELISSYWVPQGTLEPFDQAIADPVTNLKKFVLTPSVELNLRHVARSVVIGKYPLLLQGPTSAGKTSLILYVAARLGQKCVRINNHEHTDIQEYLGSYVSDKDGKLTFQEGRVLVQAVRLGWWIILDELNLAPSEVLEALNRLLDDNRELFIPETQTTIQPHPRFMLFATQNPPGLYGGRKVLSRAFRNRFIELQVDEVPPKELQQILQERSALPPSYCSLLITIMLDLQRIRAQSSVFAGKAGFITTRDLLRWAQRQPTTKQKVAEEGYFLLAERLRKDEDKLVVQQVLEKHCGATIDLVWGTPEHFAQVQTKLSATDGKGNSSGLSSISITSSLRRLFALVGRCLQHQEPVLLVGDTGAGKTTVCQLYSLLFDQSLHILNCHQHTETADFLGSLRPVRGKDAVLNQLHTLLQQFTTLATSFDVDTSALDAVDTTNVMQLFPVLEPLLAKTQHIDDSSLQTVVQSLLKLKQRAIALFEWVDGPLVTSMKGGDLFLVDEINLADDAVLERLNSVLEPARGLVLAEKGDDAEHITADPKWRILATMNPGGDFGKRELSPALRNRFTEIWVPSLSSASDLAIVVRDRLPASSVHLAPSVLQFVQAFNGHFSLHGWKVTLRDLLSWLNFMHVSTLPPSMAYVQGAALSILDGLGLGSTQSLHAATSARTTAYGLLLASLPPPVPDVLPSTQWETQDTICGVSPFFIPRGPQAPVPLPFSLAAPTTMKNLQRVLRALQVSRPILLEGSPGVGKTSLIHALAQLSGQTLVRINLSEQTDVADLFGSDLPSTDPDATSPFTWCDGVFLRALKAGQWVLLDELNLASQSVLEGLNACLDHRGTVYIPEIDKSFHCPSTFRVFAAQNPLRQGGGRKGLPKSFLNRFTRVVVDTLANEDLNIIATALYPSIDPSTIEKMIAFNALVHQDTMVQGSYGRQGAPWEFNLRDVFRWCTLASALTTPSVTWYIPMLYTSRFRTVQDRVCLERRWRQVFGDTATSDDVPPPLFHITPDSLQVGVAVLPRASFSDLSSLPPLLTQWLEPTEALMHCVRLQWPALLVGPSGSGKSAIVKLLASLTGHRLHELGLSSGTDATELLGCFEQVDVQRRVQEVQTELSYAVQKLQQQCILQQEFASVAQLADAEYAVLERQRNWYAYLSTMLYICLFANIISSRKGHKSELDPMTVTLLQQLLALVVRVVDKHTAIVLPLSLDSIQEKLDSIKLLASTAGRSSCFEWVDGTLLQALEAGEWLLLDNVNFCSASVLDRLNSLLEINGELLVNECGVVNGTLRVVKPHPDFRIFLAMDAQFGEVSRAMRNRCIEIALLPPNVISTKSNLDMLSLIQSVSSIQFPLSIYHQFQTFHEDMMQQDRSISWRHAYNWSQLTQAYVDHGFATQQACQQAMLDIFGIAIDLVWPPEPHYAPPSLSTDVFVRDASAGMTRLQSRLALYLETPNMSNNAVLDVVQLLCGAAAAHWPKSLLLSNHESWTECAKTQHSDELATAMHPWAIYRSGQHDGFASPLVQHAFAKYLADESSLQHTWNVLASHIKALNAAMPGLDIHSLYGNRPAREILRAEVLQHGDDTTKALWVKVEAVLQTLEMVESTWWHRYEEQTLLGINSSGEKRSQFKKSKREVKPKAGHTVLNQSYQCFLHGSDAVDVDNDVVPVVYPFLSALDTCVHEFVQRTLHHQLTRHQVSAVQSVLHLRFAWSHVLTTEEASVSFPWHSFLVGWKWLVKAWQAFGELCVTDLTTSVVHVHDMVERMEYAIATCIGCARAKDTLWKRGGHRQLPPCLTTWTAISAVEKLAAACSNVPSSVNQLSLVDLLCTNNSVFQFQPALVLSMPPSYVQEVLHALTTYAWFIETSGQSFDTLKQLPDALRHQLETIQAKYVANHSHLLVYLQPQDDDDDVNQDATVLLLSEDESPVIASWIQMQLAPLREFRVLELELHIVSTLATLLVESDAEFAATVQSLVRNLEAFLTLQRQVHTRSAVTLVPHQDLLWRAHKYVQDDGVVVVTAADHAEFRDVVAKHLNSAMVYFHERLWNSSVNSLDAISSRVYHTDADAVTLSKVGGFLRLFQAVETTLAMQYLESSSKMPIVDVTVSTTKLKQAADHWAIAHQAPNLFGWSHDYLWSLVLATLYIFVPRSHQVYDLLASYRQESSESIPTIVQQLQAASTDTRFTLSLPVLEAFLTLYHSYKEHALLRHGVSWTLVGLWRFGLLTPSSPLDPALIPLIKRDFLLGRMAQWAVHHTVDACMTNLTPQDYPVRDPQPLSDKIDTLQLMAIERPCDKNLFGDLFQDIVRFATSIMTKKVVHWCQHVDDDDKNAAQLVREIKMFQQTTDSFVARLQAKYTDYRDVVEPVVASVYHAKDGLSLVAHVLEAKATAHVQTLARTVLCMPSPHTHHATAEVLLKHSDTLNEHHVSTVDRLTAALNQVELHYRNQASLRPHAHHAMVDTAPAIFDAFLQLWSENQAKLEREKEQADALYKFKTRTLEIESEEQLLEKEYRQQFPDFAKAFSDLLATDTLDGANPNSEDEKEPSPLPDHVVHFVAACHERLFVHTWATGTSLKSAWIKKYALGFHLKPSLNSLLDAQLDTDTRGGHLVYTQHVLDEQAACDTVPFLQLSASYVANIDFHRDPHVKEVVLVRKPLQRMMLRLQSLLIQWPDNAILQKLLLVSNRLRQMSNQVPLAQILVGVELLLKNAQEWQAIASKDVSIQEEMAALSALVVRWRKLELYSWPQLMVIKERSFQLEARKAWFHLYSLLTAKPEIQEVGAVNLNWMVVPAPLESAWLDSWRYKLFDTMEGFLRSCTVGQFQTRLVLLYSFCSQLFAAHYAETSAETYRLACMMYHLYRYYAQHLTYNLHPMWARLPQPIQTKLDEFVKISKWDEQTYYSLALSAEKSHRKLMKFVRDYEEVLNMPMQAFLDRVIDGNITSEKYDGIQALQSTWIELKTRQDPIEVDDEDAEDVEIPIWRVVAVPHVDKSATFDLPEALTQVAESNALRWLLQLPSLSRKIHKFATHELLSDKTLRVNQQGRHLSEELCTAVLLRIDSLKAETAPKGAKKKALIDLLAELKNQGWSTLKTKTPPQQAHIQSLLELEIPRVESSLRLHASAHPSTADDPLPIWAQADSYYYRYLAQLQALRYTVISGYNKDISWSEVDKMSGYAENMLHSILQQRASLESMAHTHEGLLQHLHVLTQGPSPWIHAQETLKKWHAQQTEDLLQLLQWVDELRLAHPHHPLLETSKGLLRQCGKDLKRTQLPQTSGVPTRPMDDGNFDTSTSYGFQDKSPSPIVGFSPEVLARDIQLLNPEPLLKNAREIALICAHVRAVLVETSLTSITAPLAAVEQRNLEWVQSHQRDDADDVESTTFTDDQVEFVTSFAQRLNGVVESVLVSIQKACDYVAHDGKVDETPTLQKCQDYLLQLVHSTRVNHLSTQMDELWQFLKNDMRSEWSHVYQSCVRWMQALLPSWKLVVAWHHQLLSDVVYVHKSMSKCDYVMIRIFRTLLSNGFCKAPEESEEKDGGGNMNFEDDVEGTGMGEGDGKKDVSDQIEDEEQLLGLKGDEPQEPPEKKKDEDQDKGLEMQNDFDGAMEDVPEDDDKDDDDKDEDDKEELDREMGEFDEDNIVDEKRWGEDSDDEDENIDKEKEKFDDQSKMDEGEALEDEVRGKDGDEDEKDKKEEDKPKEKPPADNAGNDDDDESKEDEDGNMPDDDGVNEDTEDKYEDEHEELAPRDALPDDEEQKKDEDEFADDMNLDGEDKEEQEAADIDETMPDEDQPEDGEDGDPTADPDQNDDDEETKEDEDEPEAVPLGAGNEEQEMDVPSNDDPETDKTDDQPPPPPPETEKNEESKSAGAVAGVESKDGQDALEPQDRDENNEDDDDDAAEDADRPDDEDTTTEQQQGAQSNPNGSELKPVVGAESQEEQSRERKDPNPYRSPEKAQEHWRRRMEILDTNQTQNESQANEKPDDKDEQGGVGEMADEDDKNVDLALAPTDDAAVPEGMMEEDEDDSNDLDKKDDDAAKQPDPVKEDKPNDQPKAAAPQDPLDAKPSNKNKPDGLTADNVDVEMDNPDDDSENDLASQDFSMENADEFAPVVASGVDVGNKDDQTELLEADEVDIDALRADLDASMQLQTVDSIERGTALWSTYDQITRAGAQRLCEQLRLVLAPMLRSRLQGDYRTGKRINMRKVIPYIASSFRKDKIWLRRTKPSKRAYQVMVAIDDSESMADNHAGRLALEALTTLCKGMTQLEVGEIAVVKFGEKVNLLHPFDMPFTDDTGARVIRAFQFNQTKTHMVDTLEAIQGLLNQAKQNASGHGNTEITQIVFLISDGRFDKDGRTKMQKLVQAAMEQQQLIVLLIVDHPKDGQGICDTQSVSFVKGKVEMTPYMDNFPFPYYVIMKNTTMLPETLCNALRQWFELLQGSD
ncbi:hypothetical protein DYB30_003550 [Aphanomyces astaci]|uniref:Midasin n=2 Tax=Aphanomyces astaci TaxID=112090 RepID=A0A397DIH7_APHAT|nr:hypothetical protein DYB30_003550 [Aphanomyces astaci]